MIDKRTQANLDTLDPKARAIFIPFIEAAKAAVLKTFGAEYVGISGHRTWKEQDALYAQGRTKPGQRVTNAKGGQSNHNFGIAMDFGVFKGGKYLDTYTPKLASKVHNFVGELSRKYKLEWGGDWKMDDEPHFEVKTGLTLSEKRAKYLKKGSVL